MTQKKIVFHVGGVYHPTEEQAAAIIGWLGDDYSYGIYAGASVFEALDDADLLVLMGMHWSGMGQDPISARSYEPMQSTHRVAFEQYVASGRPLLGHHAAIFSYDDWPRFGHLLGFQWRWDKTGYAPVMEYRAQVIPTGHPLIQGVSDYIIVDEIYIGIEITPGLNPQVHAAVHIPDDQAVRSNGHQPTREIPLVFSAEGGRVEGAGKLVYLVNGHDMQAFASPALQQLWRNAVMWLLDEQTPADE